MNTKPAKQISRQEAIDKMVADGWSREFAEAFIPMPLAQARREGYTIRRYQSPITGLVNARRG